MIGKKYLNSLLMVSTILASSVLSMPVNAGTINLKDEEDAWNTLTKRANESVAEVNKTIKAEEHAAVQGIEEEIQNHHKALVESRMKPFKQDEENRLQRDNEKQSVENRLAEIDAELTEKLKPYEEAIAQKRPNFEERTQVFNQNIKARYQSKVDILSGPYARYWEGLDSQQLGWNIGKEQAKINDVWKELMGEDEKKIEAIRKAHNEAYSEESRKLFSQKWDADRKYEDAKKALYNNSEHEEFQEKTKKAISDLNQKANELRLPHSQLREVVLQDTLMHFIENDEILKPFDPNNNAQ